MQIRLADFKEGVPTAVHEVYDSKQLDLEFVDLKYSKPLEMRGTVEKEKDTLVFRGHLTSEIEHICGRCLGTVKNPLDRSFELYYEIKGEEILETLEDLRETLILEHPISFLCKESCKGLCPECGINFNESDCKCRRGNSSDRFLDLKKIWPHTHKGKES